MYKLLRRIRIRYRIYFILALCVACIAFLLMVSVRNAKQQYIEFEKQNTHNLVESAKNIVEHFYDLSQQGAMPEVEAKRAAIEALKDIRLSDRSYVYLYHDRNFMVMHPFLPEQNFPDYTPADIQRSVEITEQQFEQHRVRYGLPERRRTPMEILFKNNPVDKTGFFEYVYIIDDDGLGFIAEVDDPFIPKGAPSKLGYGSYFAPWQWTVLGGVYLGDLDQAVSQSVSGLLRISIIGLLITAAVAWVVSRTITKPINLGMNRINLMLDEKKFSIPQINNGDEIYSLGILFNGLLSQIEERDLHLRKKSFDLEVSNRALSEHKKSLERTVEERTQDYKAAKEEAEQATKAKSQFLATMTHELRTPMSGVLGIVDLLKETSLSQQQQEYVNIISASGEQLLDIVGNILNFEKLVANKLELEKINFNLHDLLRELVMPFKLRLRDNSKLQFVVDIADECPKNIVGDPLRVKQVLNNFLSNAFKFTQSGEVRVKAEKINRGGEPYITIAVQDTGVGLNKEQQENLFRDYQQADKSVARNYGGTGLGLSISKKIVTLMGGTIGVKSNPNIGSTFFFDFPYIREDSALQKQSNISDGPLGATDFSGLNVLVAEDNSVNQMVIKGYLRKFGIDPVLVENGKVAFDQYLEHDFDVVLMDINMPVQDGVETTIKIREYESDNNLSSTPIYALTAANVTDSNDKYLSAGMNGVLSKPINLADLTAALNESAQTNTAIIKGHQRDLTCKPSLPH